MDEKIAFLNKYTKDTLIDYLGIEYTCCGDGFLEATMPIDRRTQTPVKIAHGGALMALVESVGSALSFLYVNLNTQDVRGLEINGNHLKGTPAGKTVTARATMLHCGKRTHVCEVKIYNEDGQLVNVSRMTNIVVDKK